MRTTTRCASKICLTGIVWFLHNILFAKLIEWWHYNVFFSKAAASISGVIFSRSLVYFAVVSVQVSFFFLINSVQVSYLTAICMKGHLPIAAAIVNAAEGLSAIMVIVIAHISDACVGRYKTIVVTNAAYVIGLMLFWFSTERETPITRLSTFCVAAVLVAIGKAVEEPPLKEFLADQLRREEKEGGVDEERVEARTTFWWDFARILGAFIAVTCLSNAPRTMTFVFLAMVMGVTHSILWSGISFYHCERPTHSPVTSVLRVFKAAQRRRHLNYPQTPIQFFKNDTSELLLLPHIPFFRWLDKAAIVESPTSSAEEQMRLGKLCTVTQVKDVKRLLKMMPMWTTFVVYSLVEATGSTFFLEHIEAPISFVVFKVFSSFTFSYLYDSIILKKRGRNACFLAFGGVYFYSTKVMVMDSSRRRRATLLRIGAGMASSVLCCGAAWLVEAHRLNSKKGADDRDKTIGWTSNLWLLPQFFLWGLMEGLARKGLDDFTNVQVAKSMASYGSSFNDCVLGIGKFLTVLFVFFRSWFGDTISKSHLDKYYRMLALLGLGNLCYYCFVSFFFYAREEAQGEEEELDATALSQSLLPTRERGSEVESMPNSSLSFPTVPTHLI